ncbi:MAG: hypothetical protein MJA83_01385 [Gammaproteobacteria bacterium]|nr:hypothetical protein [Gammaproteobacteria bacterium]
MTHILRRVRMGRLFAGMLAIALLMNMNTSLASPHDDAVNMAKTELAEHLTVSESGIQLKQARAVEWPNTALGCPQKGMQYLDVIVPGYRVELVVDERSYRVHVGNGRAVVCER